MKNANNELKEYTGTENWFRHPLSRYLYTDGVCAMAEMFQAYWLIDLVFSHQLTASVKKEAFQKWVLQRLTGNRFVAVADDGNGREIARQEIPFSDFNADQVTLYFTDGVLLLPSEY
jgi:hypothetical protein